MSRLVNGDDTGRYLYRYSENGDGTGRYLYRYCIAKISMVWYLYGYFVYKNAKFSRVPNTGYTHGMVPV